MASDKNSLTIEGRLTQDPEIKRLPKGSTIAKLRIASNRYTLDRGKSSEAEPVFRKYTTFVAVDAWNELAHSCETLSKASRVRIVGQLRQESWENAEGENRQRLLINAQDIVDIS